MIVWVVGFSSPDNRKDPVNNFESDGVDYTHGIFAFGYLTVNVLLRGSPFEHTSGSTYRARTKVHYLANRKIKTMLQ